MTHRHDKARRGHLVVEGLHKHFPIRAQGIVQRLVKKTQWLRAVNDVSLTIAPGTTFGLVGESGCGKSTLGRTILRLLEPTSGRVSLDGTDITSCSKKELFALRRDMQIVFQDPFASLSPRRTIAQTLIEPLDTHKHLSPKKRMARVHELLEMVSLRPNVLNRYPHEFSGGQRQRVGIARALALNPALLVADEAVSALDVSVQSQVLNLMRDLQQQLGLSCLFIAHDLAVVQHISDVVGVMYLGKLVEVAPAAELFANPQHPYTQALLSAVPVPVPTRISAPGGDLSGDQSTSSITSSAQTPSHGSAKPTSKAAAIVRGEVPSPVNPPSGCAFHPRCPMAIEKCRREEPASVTVTESGERGSDLSKQSHRVSCHLSVSE